MYFHECKIEAYETEADFRQRLLEGGELGLLEAKAIARKESLIRDVYMAETVDQLKEVLFRMIGND